MYVSSSQHVTHVQHLAMGNEKRPQVASPVGFGHNSLTCLSVVTHLRFQSVSSSPIATISVFVHRLDTLLHYFFPFWPEVYFRIGLSL